MQVQPVRIAVLRHVAGLAPFGGGEVEMRPVEPCSFAAPAGHHDQEPGEVTPYRLAQPVSRTPEACQFSRRQIVRASLRRPGAARTGDQCARVGLDVPGVLAPVEEAGQGAEARACVGTFAAAVFQELAHVRSDRDRPPACQLPSMPSSASLT